MTRSAFYHDLRAWQAQQAKWAAIEERLATQRAAQQRAKLDEVLAPTTARERALDRAAETTR